MKEPRFLFRKEYYEITESLFLFEKDKSDFMKAIIDYGLHKKDTELPKAEQPVFSLIKILIDKDREITDTLPNSNLPSQRESSAKEKGFPSFDEMQPLFINRK